MHRSLGLAALVAFASLVAPQRAPAEGAVLVPAGTPAPATLDAKIAIAHTPYGTTRWSQISYVAPGRVLWLVAARPGAAIDWADDAWLSALDEASAVRSAPPLGNVPACYAPPVTQQAPAWSTTTAKRMPTAITVHTNESEARAHIAARGFGITPEIAGRVSALYGGGYGLVAMELGPSALKAGTSPVLRVADDGDAILPLALVGTVAANVHVTAFVIGEGHAKTPLSLEIDKSSLVWGPSGPSYAIWRQASLESAPPDTFLVESSSHAAMFEGSSTFETNIPSVTQQLFSSSSCHDAALAGSVQSGTVERVCAPGAVAAVPGGGACVPVQNQIAASSFMCGTSNDLALALAGRSPSSVALTRFAGFVRKGSYGANVPVTFATGADRSPLVTMATYADCAAAPPPPSSSAVAPPSSAGGEGPRRWRRTTDGCGGTTYVVISDDEYVDEDSSGCGGDTSSTVSSSSSDSDSSDSDSDSDSDGWDTEDDDSSGADSSGWDSSSSEGSGCGGGSSSSSSSESVDSCASDSSSSSDSCDGDTSTESDGWDDADMSPKKHSHRAKKKSRSSSPVSRYAILLVALVLPLRRRTRLPKLK